MANTVDTMLPEVILRKIIDGTLTDFEDDGVTSVASYKFNRHTSLTNVCLPNLVTANGNVFQYCHGLRLVQLYGLNGFVSYNNTFSYIESGGRTIIVLPSVTNTGNGSSSTFGRGHIGIVDLGPNLKTLASDTFYTSTVSAQTMPTVATVILRSSTVVTSSTSGAINGITDVYVPSALITEYQTATNWATRYTASSYPMTFHAIEGSQYEHYYADGTPIPEET